MFANNETRLEADDDLELTAIHRAMGFEIPQAGLKLLSLSHHITYYASNPRIRRPAKKTDFPHGSSRTQDSRCGDDPAGIAVSRDGGRGAGAGVRLMDGEGGLSEKGKDGGRGQGTGEWGQGTRDWGRGTRRGWTGLEA
jgi:hypothetical protein